MDVNSKDQVQVDGDCKMGDNIPTDPTVEPPPSGQYGSSQLNELNSFPASQEPDSMLGENLETPTENASQVSLEQCWEKSISCNAQNGVIESSGNHSSQLNDNKLINGEENSASICPDKITTGTSSENSYTLERVYLDECWDESVSIVIDTVGRHGSSNANGLENGEGMPIDPSGDVRILSEVFIVSSDESSKEEKDGCDLNYRENSDSSVSDLSSTTEDDSDIAIEYEDIVSKGPQRHEPVCRGEFLLSDLPPIEDLKISVHEEDCIKVGVISSIVGELVVVQALPNTPALDLGTVLFLENGKVTLGKIFDVLGQVKEPFYTVRFNSEKHARERGATEGADVYCAPKTDHTSFVFVSEMMKMRGSDASWEHNNEPPLVCLDYSDDEEERQARRNLGCNRNKENHPSDRRKKGTKMREASQKGRGCLPEALSNEVNAIEGLHPPPIPPPPVLRPPSFPYNSPCPMHPTSNLHSSRPLHPPGHPPVMFRTPPPNFNLPLHSGLPPSLLAPYREGFPSSAPPPMRPHPSGFFMRPFHIMPTVPPPVAMHPGIPMVPPHMGPPPVPLPPGAPIPSGISPFHPPHMSPILCPRFPSTMAPKKGGGL